MPRRATYKCPKCNSTNMVPIVYGMPGPEMQKDEIEGKIHLGGCGIKIDANGRYCNNDRYCNDCENEWNKIDNY